MIPIDMINGEFFSIWKCLFESLFFGIFMSLFLVTSHKNSLIKLGIKEFTDDSLSVKQTKEITAFISKDELIARIKTDPIFSKMKIQIADNVIYLNSSWTWKSYGEKIQIIITDTNVELKSIFISSKPKHPTALVDNGKNKKNVDRLENIIKNG
ncbi:MAG: hypothetical protein PHD97_12690 [Bacteroidales bacterium]|nr:hypothetical protein [Bacteroidales bacterium]